MLDKYIEQIFRGFRGRGGAYLPAVMKLATIEHDESIPAALRARACELDLEYPTAQALRDWLTTGNDRLPEAWTTNIASAYELSIAVQWPVVDAKKRGAI